MPFDHATARPIESAQIAVGIMRGTFGTHIGLVFTDAQKITKVLHLAWHKKLRVDDYPMSGCWIATIPNIPPTTAKAFVGVLRKIAKRQPHMQPHLRYGINVLAAVGSFSVDGDYKAPKGSDGLTCATFVSELFRALGVPLVVESTWPNGVNVDWGKAVCSQLAKEGADADHVQAVQANVNGMRIRPEELGAAADTPYVNWPIRHEDAAKGAPAVVDCLNSRCPVLPGGQMVH